MPKLVKCPTCKKESEYSSQNQYRPFCSERCQLIDLGEWAAGKYAVPVSVESDPSETANIDSPDRNTQETDE